MIHTLRKRLATPGAKFGIAGFMLGTGIRMLVELTHTTRNNLEELTQLHRDTRARIFVLETIEKGKRVLDDSPPAEEGNPDTEADWAAYVRRAAEQPTDQPTNTEEIPQ